jgi:hypothetical protein
MRFLVKILQLSCNGSHCARARVRARVCVCVRDVQHLFIFHKTTRETNSFVCHT